MKVRGKDVLLPTTQAGAYPRPIFMEGKAFPIGVGDPEFPSFRMRELYRDAVAVVVKDQLDSGLDIVTDGGQHYENETSYEMAEAIHYLPQHLDGFLPYGENIKAFAWDLPIWKPTVVGPVGWRRPVFKPVIEAVRAATDGPMKITVGFGPLTMALMSTDEHYHDPVALAQDLAVAWNLELKDMEARGCDQVQFIEPWTMVLGVLEPAQWMIDIINRAFEGVTMYKIMHMCYGHLEGQPGTNELMAHKIFPFAFGLNCDQIHLEMASHDFSEVDAMWQWPKAMDLGVGAVDSKSLRAERPDQVADWLRRTCKVVPADQVCVSTDCSISQFRRVVAKKKLSNMVEGVRLVREEIAGG